MADFRDFNRRSGGGVSVYSPTMPRTPRPQSPVFSQPPRSQLDRMLQGTQQAPVPAPSQGGGSRLDQLLAAANQAKEDEPGTFGRGLGFIVNNPVAEHLGKVVKPLEVIDYPRRIAMSTADQLGEWFTGGEFDTTEWAENIEDQTFGFGDMFPDPTGNKWADRSIGLAGDIAFDPLTYLTGGAGVAGKAGRAAGLTRLANAQRAAVQAGDQAAIKALGGTEDLERIGRRGLNIANDAQREAMGLRRSGLYVGGPTSQARIPLTGELEQALSQAGGLAREGIKKVPGARQLREVRSPVGFLGNDLNPAYEKILTGKGPGTLEQALQAVELDNMARVSGRGFEVPASMAVDRLSEQLNKMNDAQIRNLRIAAEAGGKDNLLTQTARQMVRAARRVGVELPEIEGGSYAMPHSLTREFRDYLDDPKNAGNQSVRDFRKQSGLVDEDLLEDSGFLQRRKFRPNQDGTPGEFPIGGETVMVRTGSVDELNSEIRKAFPDYKGKIYEEDPGVAWRNYVKGLTRDVARRSSFRQGEELGFEGIRRVTLADTPDVYNPYVAQRTKSTIDLKSEDGAPSRIDEFTPNPAAPSEGNEFFEMVPDVGNTKRLAKMIQRTHKTLRQDYAAASQAKKYEISDNLETATNELLGNLRGARDAARRRMGAARTEVGDILGLGADIGNQKAVARQQIADITEQIDALAKTRYNLQRTARNRTNRRQRELLQQVQEAEAAARSERMAIEDMIARSVKEQREIGADITRRETERRWKSLTQKLSNAKQKLDQAELAARADWHRRRKLNTFTDQLIERNKQWAQENKDLIREWDELDAERLRLERMRHQRVADIQETQKFYQDEFGDRTNKYLTPEEEQTVANLSNRIAGYQQELDQFTADVESVKRQLNTPNMKRAEAAIDFGNDLADLEDHVMRQTTRERGIWANARRDVDNFGNQLMAGQGEELDRIAAPAAAVRSKIKQQAQAAGRTERAAQRRLGRIAAGTDPELNEQALAEGVESIRGSNRITDQQERLRLDRRAKTEELDSLHETASAIPSAYDKAMEDLRGARSQYEDLRDRAKSPVIRADQERAEMTVPGTVLDDLADSGAPSYTVQPMHRTVRDLRALIEQNPQMDDELLNRMEAVLHATEAGLSEVTELDVSNRQALKMLQAAEDGTLSDVLIPALRDDWRRMWDGGDIVISRELEASYHNLIVMARQPKAFGRLLTSYTNFFKTYATLSPGFHIRNGMSAIFMNTSDGVPLREQERGLRLWRKFAQSKDPVAWLESQPQVIQDAFDVTFASGAGGRFFETGVAEATPGAGRMQEAIFSNRFTRGSQQFGQDWVEGPVRLTLALDTLDNKRMPMFGADQRIDPTKADALNRITRLQFDYSQVSQFDERAKRYIPFWTFMSRNLPLQMTQMWTKPKIYNRYQSFVRNFSVEPDEFTPEYILEAGGFDTGVETPDLPGMDPGMPIFLNPDFPHMRVTEDIEKLTSVFSQGGTPWSMLSDFNPAMTAPLEFTTNQNFFTGRRYEPDDVRKASGVVDMIQFPVMLAMGQVSRGPNNEIIYSDKGVDTLRSLNPILDRVTRLAPGTAGGEVSNRQAESYLRFLGAPVRTVSDQQRQSEQRSQYYDEQDRLRREQAIMEAAAG